MYNTCLAQNDCARWSDPSLVSALWSDPGLPSRNPNLARTGDWLQLADNEQLAIQAESRNQLLVSDRYLLTRDSIESVARLTDVPSLPAFHSWAIKLLARFFALEFRTSRVKHTPEVPQDLKARLREKIAAQRRFH